MIGPGRLYFSIDINDAQNILSKNRLNDKLNDESNKYIIYEININNLELYEDPRSDGFYSYNHINPDFLKIINEIE